MRTHVVLDYRRLRGYFSEFAVRWAFLLTHDVLTFDVPLSDPADYQFLDGEQCHVAEKFNAAPRECVTQHRPCGVLPLPPFRRVLRGRMTIGPMRPRLPQPLKCYLLVTYRLVTRGHRSTGLYHTGLLVTHLRQSVFLRPALADVVPLVAAVGSKH